MEVTSAEADQDKSPYPSTAEVCCALSPRADLRRVPPASRFFLHKKPIMSWSSFVRMLPLENPRAWERCFVCSNRWTELSTVVCYGSKPLLFQDGPIPDWLQMAVSNFLRLFQETPLDVGKGASFHIPLRKKCIGGYDHIHTQELKVIHPPRNKYGVSCWYFMPYLYRQLKKCLSVNTSAAERLLVSRQVAAALTENSADLAHLRLLVRLLQRRQIELRWSGPRRSRFGRGQVWLMSYLARSLMQDGRVATRQSIGKMMYWSQIVRSNVRRVPIPRIVAKKRPREDIEMSSLVASLDSLEIPVKAKKQRQGTVDELTERLETTRLE